MNNNQLQSYFKFSAGQRIGILLLFGIIITLQLLYFLVDFSSPETANPEKQKWLSLQSELDTLKSENNSFKNKIYPFNPNFLTDFKAYKLGMTTAEIDRLLAFRKLNKFANSTKEFQEVTGISDSLLNVISPYFKFPDWVINPKQNYSNYEKGKFDKKEKTEILDINAATKEDLMKINGIGDAISDRILKQKTIFGNFVSMEQMKDVWGLQPDVIQKLNESFRIINKPNFKKIDINNASIKELGMFPYFRYPISKNIVTYRSMNGEIKDIEDLIKIKDFPVDKVKIIALYLQF